MNYRLSLTHLRQFNNLLTAGVILFALYLIGLPYLPSLQWWVQHQAPLVSQPPSVTAPVETPTINTLVLPSLGLSQAIHEGPNKYTLHYGVWHRPQTSTPDRGGNTVMAGHRFTYHDPAVFYHLDKLKLRDPVIIYWEHKRYTYTVTNIQTVLPTATKVEEAMKDPTVTLYTCTPLWSSKYRLVVTAKLTETT